MKQISLNSDGVKILGIILMTFDHLSAFLPAVLSIPLWFGWLGRPVATLFVFLTVVGYRHTRNHWGYMRNMLIGFWLMGVINYFFGDYFPVEGVELYANIFQTLFWCIFAVWLYDLWKTNVQQKRDWKFWLLAVVASILPILVSLWVVQLVGTPLGNFLFRAIPNVIFTEGGFFLIIMAVLFHAFYDKAWVKYAVIAAFSLYALWSALAAHQNIWTEQYEWMVIFAVLPIYWYNYQKGNLNKWFFYIYYPLHIVLIYLIGYSLV